MTSFDREHRSFVADLLMQEFPDTQVLLLTHDHDWYVELKRRLPGNRWMTKALLPWSDPATGIRWDGKPHGLGASRVLVEVDVMAAANRARAVMDVEMAVIAERLAIPVPFIRGARNDLRGALDLVQRFRSRAQGRFKKRNAQGNYEGWSDPADLAKAAEDWLVTYGNAGSHGRILTNLEVGRLIDACDALLGAFECMSCNTAVWHAMDAGRTHLRCDCGQVRWNL
ncbi:hypothetical protein [Roseomonas genomospecies 6]|uniref:hypothetical protein n=1 Tax=Roseomonas genomospecies 6 TaxID=214106 RepID=UPI0011F15FF6|nr:hypothetical protein [Roseomonas genomospecies 6]